MNLDPKLVSQEDRFSFLKAIFTCRNINLQDKQKMLEVEVKRDKNSDNSITAKLACNALLLDRKNKQYVYLKISLKKNILKLFLNKEKIMNLFILKILLENVVLFIILLMKLLKNMKI